MRRISTLVLFLLLFFNLTNTYGQKLKDKNIGFRYYAPAELSLPSAYKTYKVSFSGGLSDQTDFYKKLNSETLSIPGLALSENREEADIDFLYKSKKYQNISDEIKISGSGEDKKYYVKRVLVIPEVTLYVMEGMDRKRFLHKLEYEQDTITFNSKKFDTPAATKGYNAERNVEPDYDSFVFNHYRQMLNPFRKYFTNYYTGYAFYIKEKGDQYEAYEDIVKDINKDILDDEVKEKLDEGRKTKLKEFIMASEKLLTDIEREKINNLNEFRSALHSNMSFASLLIDDFSAYVNHRNAISQEHEAMAKLYVDFANVYQNYTIRNSEDFNFQEFMQGKWKVTNIEAKYVYDYNNDGVAHKQLVGTELPECVLDGFQMFDGASKLLLHRANRACEFTDFNYCWKITTSINKPGLFLRIGDVTDAGDCERFDSDDFFVIEHISTDEFRVELVGHYDPNSDTGEETIYTFKKL